MGAVLIFIASIAAAVKAGGVSALIVASVSNSDVSDRVRPLSRQEAPPPPSCYTGSHQEVLLLERLAPTNPEPFFCLQVFGFITTFLMAVNLWTSYSVACSPQVGARPQNPPPLQIKRCSSSKDHWRLVSEGSAFPGCFDTESVQNKSSLVKQCPTNRKCL